MAFLENIPLEISYNNEIKYFNLNYCIDQETYSDNDIQLKINLDNLHRCSEVFFINSSNLDDTLIDIISKAFKNKYNELLNQINEISDNGLEPIMDDIQTSPQLKIPYDPNLIRVTQGRFSLKEIYEMIVGDDYDEPILDLSPDFQREYVWDSTQKSRLIESILLKIPLPVFYLSRDSEGTYQVVDGVQRLSVIKEYFSNGFKLKNLEYLTNDCENKYYHKSPDNSLHPKFVRTLRSYQIDCNIIEPDTPQKVKLDIFKRLNTGGKSLNNQEIRNSMLKKKPRDFIRKLSKSEPFLNATNKSISTRRMMDQEMIVRYIGFYFQYKNENESIKVNYTGKMNEFLDSIIELLNDNCETIDFEKIENDFYIAMNNAYLMFNEYSFRKVTLNYQNEDKNKINKSLFTAFSILLSNYDTATVIQKGSLIDSFAQLLESDRYLYNCITYNITEQARIDTTFLRIEEFLEGVYKK